MTRRFDRFMVHVDIGTDEKLAGFSDSERLCHIAGVLALAAKSPVRGCLMVGDVEASAQHVALRAGVSKRVATTTLRKLQDVGILVRDNDLGCLRVHRWEAFNPEPKADPGNAERQARWRARNAARNGEVTPPVTPLEVEGEVEEEVTAPSGPTIVGARPCNVGPDSVGGGVR